MTSPNLNVVMSLGTTLAFIAVVLSGLDSTHISLSAMATFLQVLPSVFFKRIQLIYNKPVFIES